MNPVLLALVLAASPSTKLGVYVAGDDATSRALLAGPGCPAVATFAVTSTTIPAAQVSAFRSVCPMSRIVAQVGDPGMSIVGGTLDAEWPTWSTLLGMVGWVNLDAVEGPSEPQGAAADLQSFWTGFAVDVQQNGKVPVVGSLATGTTSSAFCPTASAIAALGKSWTWSYHAFSTGLTESLATESATTFGYRAIRDGCGLAGIPIYVTQAGPAIGRPWSSGDITWLAWLDAQLAVDSEVVGAALYEAGAADRSLSPIATQLAAYLQNPTPSDGGTPDGGSDAGQSGGVASSDGTVPSGPPGNYPKTGCATTGAGVALVALLPVLALTRRRASRLPRPMRRGAR